MKNLIPILLTLLLSFSINNNTQAQGGYVSLEGKKFQLDGQEWYPMVMNYSISVRWNGIGDWENPTHPNLFVVPRETYHPSYDEINNNNPWSNSPNSGVNYATDAIRAHMQRIKNMNFNTIRLTGFTLNPDENNEMEDYFGRNILSTFGTYQIYFSYIQTVIDAAECAGLKVILLTGRSGIESAGWQYSNFLTQLADYFKDNTTIIAYDLYNEPLYEQITYWPGIPKPKDDIYSLVKCWDRSIKKSSPNHLTTIGSSGYENAMDWDPNLMSVDFLSFHFYEHHSEMISKHLKWIAEVVSEPWIVGETGYMRSSWISPTDDNNLRSFISDVMNKTKAAGGSGFSLWNYSDKIVTGVEGNLGLISLHSGNQVTTISTSCFGNLQVYGVDKNTGIYSDILTFRDSPYSNSSSLAPNVNNYYNSGSGNIIHTGRVLSWNQGNPPIKNAVVKYDGQITFTDANGNYFFRRDNIYGAQVSAYGYANAEIADLNLVAANYNSQTNDWTYFIEDLYLNNLASIYVGNIWVNSGQSYYGSGVKKLQASNFHVYANNNSAKLEAGESIKLHPGFEAKKGSVFTARIFPTANCAASALRLENNNTFSEDEVLNENIYEKTNLITIYPNPNQGQFNILLNNIEQNTNIEVFDLMGKIVFSHIAKDNKVIIDISNQPKGIYLVKVISGDNTSIEKIIKQ